MNEVQAVPVFVRMICSFLAAFPAIALWSRTRNPAWMFVVLGALFFFIDALYGTLVLLGLATYALPFWPELPLLRSVLAGLPHLLLSTGFLIFLARNRRD